MADEPITRAEYTADLKRIDAEEARQNKRLENLEDTTQRINDLVVSIKELSVNMSAMQTTLKVLTDRLTAIEEEPAQNWKKAVWIVLAALIGAAVGAGLRSIGL
jgi:allophanate hydrolase subunit 1